MRRAQNDGTGRMDGWQSSMKPYSSNELNAIYTRIAGVGLGAGLLVPLSSVNRRRVSGPTFEVSLRCSDVVGEAGAEGQRYWDLLQQVPAIYAVGVLAFINNLLAIRGRDAEVHRILNEKFLSPTLRKAVADFRPGGPAFAVVFTRIGCLQLIRHLMLNGSSSTGNAEAPIETVGELVLFSNEYLRSDWFPPTPQPDALEVALQSVPSWDIDNPRDLAYTLARMHTILNEILPGADSQVRDLSFQIGIDSSTLTIDGLALSDFIAVVFGIHSFAGEVEKKGALSAVFDYTQVFEKVGFPQPILETFIASRSLTLSEFKAHLMGKGSNARQNFDDEIARRSFLIDSLKLYRQFPILRLDGNRAVILDIQFLVDLLTAGVYWSLFDRLPSQNRETFKQLWGRLFELYAVGLPREYYRPASGILRADVQYGEGQIDALLDYADEVFVFEIKSSLLTEPAKRAGNRASFEEDVNRKFVRSEEGKPKAIAQLGRSCQAIARKEISTTAQPRRIYPILVSDEAVVEAFCFNQYLNGVFQLEIGASTVIQPLTVMSINEFEEVLAYVSAGAFTWRNLLESRFVEAGVDPLSVHQTIYNLRQARAIELCRNEVLLDRFEKVFQIIKAKYQPSPSMANLGKQS